jgi:hypothetical protein
VTVSPRKARVACSISLILLLANCGGDSTGPAHNKPGIRAVAGAGITDTVDAHLAQSLVVEVRRADGVLASGVVVNFEPQPVSDPSYFNEPSMGVCNVSVLDCSGFFGLPATDTTDANGRASATVLMGRVAGRGVVRLSVPELGFTDSATFTIAPGAPAALITIGADPELDIGGKATLSGLVLDRYSNPRAEKATLSAGPGSAITLDAATGTVTGRDMGTQWVFMRYMSLLDSARVRVVPPGRLLVWSPDEQTVRLVNINGSDERTIVSNVSSTFGAFPQFDRTRQRITVHTATDPYMGLSNELIIVDTTGASRRNIGFSAIMATRYLTDGAVLAVATRDGDPSHPGFSLWSVATDNTITFLVALPELESTYGGADISHDGTRVAYVTKYGLPGELRVLQVLSGSTTVLDSQAGMPRWSAQDDRLAYLTPANAFASYVSIVTVINANGSGRRVLANAEFSPGVSWSPDGIYVIGRRSEDHALRVIRVSDETAVSLSFPPESDCCHDYWQPDWR